MVDARGGVESATLERTLQRLKFDLLAAPRVVEREAGAEDVLVHEAELLASDRLLEQARTIATVLGPDDLALLDRLGRVPTLAIGGDRASVAALRSATEAAGVPLVARALPRGLARAEAEEALPAFDDEELASRPQFAFLDPDRDGSASFLFRLANVLPTGGVVAVPQTPRGIALVRNAIASLLFEPHEQGDALVALRRVAGADPRPILPPSEQAAADDAAIARMLPELVKADWNCLDIGANKGDILGLLVSSAVEGTHHAFEPLPHHAEALRLAFPSVVVHNLALSDRRGRSSFVHVQAEDAYSGIFRRPGVPPGEVALIEVETAKLDDVLPDAYAPSFVKLDTEGGEGQVIAGGLETLARHRPIILFEHGLRGSLSYGTPSCDMWDQLCGGCGLEIYTLDGYGPYSRSDFSGPKLHWNFIAVRPEHADEAARAPWFVV